MKRYHIIYEGRVQGVGFRGKLQMWAAVYNITGSIKNLDNGNVEVFAQGEKVDTFLNESLKGDHFLRIDNYVVKEEAVVENEKRFSVIYY